MFSRWLGRNLIVKKEIEEILEFSNLGDKADELASSLAFGEQRRLELARASATKPRLLLLDEPAAGMTPTERNQTVSILKNIAKSSSIIVVEHDMEFVRNLNCRVTVLNEGSILSSGSIDFITQNEKVIEVYLGR